MQVWMYFLFRCIQYRMAVHRQLWQCEYKLQMRQLGLLSCTWCCLSLILLDLYLRGWNIARKRYRFLSLLSKRLSRNGRCINIIKHTIIAYTAIGEVYNRSAICIVSSSSPIRDVLGLRFLRECLHLIWRLLQAELAHSDTPLVLECNTSEIYRWKSSDWIGNNRNYSPRNSNLVIFTLFLLRRKSHHSVRCHRWWGLPSISHTLRPLISNYSNISKSTG